MDRIIADGPRIQRWMHERSGLPIQAEFHGVAREVDGEIVSAFGYDSFQEDGCALHVCTDRPLTKALVRWAFKIPFEQWGYQYLAGIVSAKNLKSLRLATKLGFTEVGRIAGRLVCFELEKEKCRWLHERRRISTESTGP